MSDFIVGMVVGITLTIGFWLINRWYWKSMYEAECHYSEQLTNLFEQNHPFKITKGNS